MGAATPRWYLSEAGAGSVPVKLGTENRVATQPVGETVFLVDKGQAGQVAVETALDEEVAAPVSRGQRLGTLTVKVGDQTVKQVPLVASEGVSRLSWWDIFLKVLGKVSMARE